MLVSYINNIFVEFELLIIPKPTHYFITKTRKFCTINKICIYPYLNKINIIALKIKCYLFIDCFLFII